MHRSIYRRIFWRLEIDLNKGALEGLYGTGISKVLSVHRLIYRRIFWRLEINLDKGALTGLYGTGIGDWE